MLINSNLINIQANDFEHLIASNVNKIILLN